MIIATRIQIIVEMAILLRNLKQLWVIDINASRDREGSFDPKIIPKRSKDVSGIEYIWFLNFTRYYFNNN
jgi:hypothetical protein